jgi:hypothetical protein
LSGAARVLVLAALIALLGCVSRRVDVAWPTSGMEGGYSAVLSGSLTWHGKGIPITGGCAVDPQHGIRVELRDAMGMTRLLLLVNPSECRLIDPAAGLISAWSSPEKDIPWAPEDLTFLFTARRPAGLTRLTGRTGHPALEASWQNSRGRMTARFEPFKTGPCPFSDAVLAGPGGARLELKWNSVVAASFSAGAFDPPPMNLEPVAVDRLLNEIEP